MANQTPANTSQRMLPIVLTPHRLLPPGPSGYSRTARMMVSLLLHAGVEGPSTGGSRLWLCDTRLIAVERDGSERQGRPQRGRLEASKLCPVTPPGRHPAVRLGGRD